MKSFKTIRKNITNAVSSLDQVQQCTGSAELSDHLRAWLAGVKPSLRGVSSTPLPCKVDVEPCELKQSYHPIKHFARENPAFGDHASLTCFSRPYIKLERLLQPTLPTV